MISLPNEKKGGQAMTQMQEETLVEYTLDLGRQMMECGAEAWRADNTIARIFRAYGLDVLDVHTMATQTAATVKFPDGRHYTSTCMIQPEKTGTNLRRLEGINAVARRLCEYPPDIEDLPVVMPVKGPRWSWSVFAGYLLGAGAFAVFFGGRLWDGIMAALIGGAIYLMEQFRGIHRQNRTIYTVVACFLSGLLARWISSGIPGLRLDMIVIGDIMLFIPGLSLVNGVRELFYADILTGVYRIIEALLGTGAIAVGYAAALLIGGGLL